MIHVRSGFLVSLLLLGYMVLAACSLPMVGAPAPTSEGNGTTPQPEAQPAISSPTATTLVSPEAEKVAQNERIVFASDRGGDFDIYVMNADGSGLANLSMDPARDTEPAWSPDRKQIAFVSDRGGKPNIYLIPANPLQAEDMEVQQLTTDPEGAVSPSWSPDGRHIVFVALTEDDAELATLQVSNGTVTTLKETLQKEQNPSWSPDGTRIAFSAIPMIPTARMTETTEPDRDIFLMNVDGSGALVNLTNHAGQDDFPAWSPDGKRIAFQASREDNTDIFVMYANGFAQTRLTDAPAVDSMPSWSSDGLWLAFASDRAGHFDMYTMRDNGADQTSLAPGNQTDVHPSWGSPEAVSIAEYIAFGSDADRIGGSQDVFVANVNGTDVRNLTKDLAMTNSQPAWSPDGTRIAFISSRSAERYDIFLMNADGSNPIQLTEGNGLNLHPSWSPDGTRIGYESKRDGNWNLYTYDLDSRTESRLTDSPSRDGNMTWSPDGTRIAFVSDREEPDNLDLYVLELESNEIHRITTDPASDVFPDWSPTDDLLVFRSNRHGNHEIFVVQTEPGSHPQRRTFNPAIDDHPAWSSDGTRIVFTSDRATGSGSAETSATKRDIYMMNADGRGVNRVTQGQKNEEYPDWRPSPRSLMEQ